MPHEKKGMETWIGVGVGEDFGDREEPTVVGRRTGFVDESWSRACMPRESPAGVARPKERHSHADERRLAIWPNPLSVLVEPVEENVPDGSWAVVGDVRLLLRSESGDVLRS